MNQENLPNFKTIGMKRMRANVENLNLVTIKEICQANRTFSLVELDNRFLETDFLTNSEKTFQFLVFPVKFIKLADDFFLTRVDYYLSSLAVGDFI